jgi:outer membrane receptor for ferrienterochelin and colicins
MNFNSQKKLIFFIFQVCLCFAIYGQDKCNSINLNDIKADYQIGKFESVEKSLRSCLENGNVDYVTKKDGYRLLAMNSIAMDLMDRAEQDVKELLKIDRNYKEMSDDPIVFLRLIERLRIGGARMVTSVSKIAENLNEAPANIVIVTREEIKERGYMDLEQVFHDLPGFDISKTSGSTYSSIYQRGYRTNNNNDRALLLIDGIEDNDLYTNKMWISRQYPVSNLKQIDVIYGPSSTMYGANAFVGVNNLTTLLPEDIIPSTSENVGITGFYQRGSYNTQTADITVAFRKNKLSGTVTGRFFSSDEFDRSGFDDFDYQYSPADVSEYQNLRMEIDATVADNAETQRFVTIGPDYAQYTPEGAALARELDILGYTTDDVYKNPAYSNKSLNKYILAKLMYSDFTFGFQSWIRDEGIAWNKDTYYAGTDNGNRWAPRNLLYYLRYDKNVSEKWNISNLALYKEHDLAKNTGLTKVPNLYFDRGKPEKDALGVIINGGDGYRDLIDNIIPQWQKSNRYVRSWQIRDEVKATYTSKNFNMVSGLEARYSAIQGNYSENEETLDEIKVHNSIDIGLYTQGNYIKDDLKLVLGGRVDYNKIDENGGYGTVFNPRAVLIYSPKEWVFKAMYSEAFKDATNYDKYSTITGIRDEPNPTLKPEKVKNSEVSVSWDNTLTKKKGTKFFMEASVYYTNYSGVVQTVKQADGRFKNQNAGGAEIFGAQLNSLIEFNKNLKLNFNYSFTSPYTIPFDETNNIPVRIADIATHKGNVILNWKFKKMTNSSEYHFNWNNRINISGERRMGIGTTTESTDEDGVNLQPISRVAPFAIATSYFSYSNKFGLTFGLGINNALDESWNVPGARAQTGRYPAVIPMAGRNYFLNLRYDLK